LPEVSLEEETLRATLTESEKQEGVEYAGRSCILKMDFCELSRIFSLEKTSSSPQVVVIAHEETKNQGHARSKSVILRPLLYCILAMDFCEL